MSSLPEQRFQEILDEVIRLVRKVRPDLEQVEIGANSEFADLGIGDTYSRERLGVLLIREGDVACNWFTRQEHLEWQTVHNAVMFLLDREQS